MLLPLVLFSVFLAGCAGYAAKQSPAKQALPGNRHDEKPVGDEYVEAMRTSARQGKRADNRFRIHTLLSTDCQICKSQLEAALELQTKMNNVDVTAYRLQGPGASARGIVPLTILQYGDCRGGIAAAGVLDADSLAEQMNRLKDSCDFHKSIPFTKHFAPIDL